MRKSFCVIISAVGILTSLLGTQNVSAESIDTLDGIVRNPHTLTTITPSEDDHWYSNPKLMTGIKSSNSFGKMSTIGQQVRSREEVFLGFRNTKGWGITAMISDTMKMNPGGGPNSQPGGPGSVSAQNHHGGQHNNQSNGTNQGGLPPSPNDANGYGALTDRSGVGDPSLGMTHPVYDWGYMSLAGMLSQTFPVSDYSKSTHSWLTGYYSVLSIRMPERYRFSNTLMFHYVSKDVYAPPFDTTLSTGVMSAISRHFNNWFRAGIGQRFQVDNHLYGPVGQYAELYTSCDFMISPTVFAGPRIHFPIYSQNSVSLDGSPTNPAIGNISAEFYLQAAL